MKLKFKCSHQTTIIFIIERASCEYLACLNRSPDEEVMIVLRNHAMQKETRWRVCFQPENTRSGVFAERSIFVQKLHAGGWNEQWETPSRVFCPENVTFWPRIVLFCSFFTSSINTTIEFVLGSFELICKQTKSQHWASFIFEDLSKSLLVAINLLSA